MVKETEEQEEQDGGLTGFSENEMYDSESSIGQQQEEEEIDLMDFDGIGNQSNEEEENEEQEENENEEEEENEDDDSLSFENEEEEEEFKLDIEDFNKKFGKDFKSEAELKAFLEGPTDTQEKGDSAEQKILDDAEAQIDILSPLLKTNEKGAYLINSESLMRKQYETIALNSDKDLNDYEVQAEINEKIENLKDKDVLDIYADNLRGKLEAIVSKSEASKNEILEKRTEAKAAEDKANRSAIQDELVALHNLENFYGVELDKKSIESTYKDIVSGKFLEDLKTDRKALAELAMMRTMKEKIFQKSSGLTYNDGMKAVLDEFKNKKQDSPAVKAQKRSSAASKHNSEKGLIDSILYTKPQESKV